MPPAFCAVKAKANKNWQSQHLTTLEVFVSETLRKRISLVSLQTNNEMLVQTNNADASLFLN